jgi:hypothetical protein
MCKSVRNAEQAQNSDPRVKRLLGDKHAFPHKHFTREMLQVLQLLFPNKSTFNRLARSAQ